MANTSPRLVARLKRKKRIRKNMFGNQERPRLSVFRTAKHIYAQIIDDTKGITLVAASTLDKEYKDTPVDGKKQDVAKSVGNLIGKRAMDKGIKKVVFDRNGFLFHGRVKALSDGAREAGLEF
ncbi:MAG TPA: 50S ribosomal protein L18 [Desulfobacter sp.]|jgi:large subunit ribosomal protein L18|uniref:50S ribosomal protein L18 n=1 Tax=unclassified Desulfobacter TaxID=2634406 RepID=UPI000E8CEB19|nr:MULTISPECIES: 50S ribosomal protein L18 [unclassified Desulfobacter]HRF89246.1 50S ribosomal protein L18 [Desulfobacter postgatei]MBP8828065.1 50S ribosomal protein L18 [Desulfobacter sp.]MBP9597602.1 50S ribosomal protein L18 [Desulfobacter sp.]HAR35056.1 50S ribosomal protein L18 [Desulfobacter sp.]HBT87375.1 50S ribosomal protein L18 [Desulfobacter sp.]